MCKEALIGCEHLVTYAWVENIVHIIGRVAIAIRGIGKVVVEYL
jgi:hypothetical protein